MLVHPEQSPLYFLPPPAAGLAVADSDPVGKEGACEPFSPAWVVLLTPSKSSHPKPLLSRLYFSPISPLDTTLTKNRGYLLPNVQMRILLPNGVTGSSDIIKEWRGGGEGNGRRRRNFPEPDPESTPLNS